MRSFITMGFVATAILLSSGGMAKDQAVTAPHPPVYVDGSLCTKPDQIVFSCALDKSRKIVSICAAGAVEKHRFYYSFGRQNKIELSYPDQKDSTIRSLNATRLSLANSWSTAYSFFMQDKKYIVDASEGMAFIGESGKMGFRTPYHAGGVLVQKVGEDKAMLKMRCTEKKIHYNEGLIQSSLQELKPDRDIKRPPYG